MRVLRLLDALVGFATLALATIACAPAPRPAPHGNAADQREDLTAFERGFFAVDRSYSPENRAVATHRLSKLTQDAGSISDTLFILTLSQIAALADNGHSGVIYRGGATELGRVGVRLAPFGSEFVALWVTADHTALLGGSLVAVDDAPIARLREAAHTLTGGIPARRDQMAPLLLESPGQLHALGLVRSPSEAAYTFRLRDGSTRKATLAVVSAPGGGGDQSAEILAPAAAPSGWRAVLDRDKAPWSLQEPGETMRRRDLPELDAVEIQLRANHDGARPIAAFLDESEREGRAAGYRNVVLDMRANGGGDLTQTRDWMSHLPSRLPPGGRVIVLMGPWTFSAAISSIGYLKQAGQERVVLVGEAPGDRLRFWAEGSPISLPHSGAMVLMATGQHDYVTGCRGHPECHPEVVSHPIAVKSLDPEVAAPWTLESYVAGRDPGMEAATRLLSRPR